MKILIGLFVIVIAAVLLNAIMYLLGYIGNKIYGTNRLFDGSFVDTTMRGLGYFIIISGIALLLFFCFVIGDAIIH